MCAVGLEDSLRDLDCLKKSADARHGASILWSHTDTHVHVIRWLNGDGGGFIVGSRNYERADAGLEPFARSRQPPAPPRVAPGPGPRAFFFSARTASSDPSDCVPRIPNQPCWGAAAGVWRRGFSTTNYPLPVGTERPGARRD